MLDVNCGVRAGVCAVAGNTSKAIHQIVAVIAVLALPGTDCCASTVCLAIANCIHYDELLCNWSLETLKRAAS